MNTDRRYVTIDKRVPAPPFWAEFVLRLVLTPQSRDAVSGDLLEEYRAVVIPTTGRRRANWWYVRQVGGYVVRSCLIWAVLFAGVFLARQAYDWFVPTADFKVRSAVTTYTAVALLLGSGYWAAWRAGSALAGMLAGIATTTIAAVISLTGAALLLAAFHDPVHLENARNSGGIGEVFVLPVFAIALGAVLGAIGGAAGAGARHVTRIDVS
jgi:hypothetical protein